MGTCFLPIRRFMNGDFVLVRNTMLRRARWKLMIPVASFLRASHVLPCALILHAEYQSIRAQLQVTIFLLHAMTEIFPAQIPLSASMVLRSEAIPAANV